VQCNKTTLWENFLGIFFKILLIEFKGLPPKEIIKSFLKLNNFLTRSILSHDGDGIL
jgi:hypothetical protein